MTQVEVRCGTRVDALRFITNMRSSPQYGRNGGTHNMITVEKGYKIVGFFGRSDQRIDQLGFI